MTAHEDRPARYQVAPGVAWSVETAGLRLADGKGGVFELGYPEAAVWDLLSRGLGVAKVVELTRWIAAEAPEAARARVGALLAQWRARGWIVVPPPGGAGDGGTAASSAEGDP